MSVSGAPISSVVNEPSPVVPTSDVNTNPKPPREQQKSRGPKPSGSKRGGIAGSGGPSGGGPAIAPEGKPKETLVNGTSS